MLQQQIRGEQVELSGSLPLQTSTKHSLATNCLTLLTEAHAGDEPTFDVAATAMMKKLLVHNREGSGPAPREMLPGSHKSRRAVSLRNHSSPCCRIINSAALLYCSKQAGSKPLMVCFKQKSFVVLYYQWITTEYYIYVLRSTRLLSSVIIRHTSLIACSSRPRLCLHLPAAWGIVLRHSRCQCPTCNDCKQTCSSQMPLDMFRTVHFGFTDHERNEVKEAAHMIQAKPS